MKEKRDGNAVTWRKKRSLLATKGDSKGVFVVPGRKGRRRGGRGFQRRREKKRSR